MCVPPFWWSGRCFYCDLRYSALGKMETFDEDFHYVSSAAGISTWEDSVGDRIHQTEAEAEAGMGVAGGAHHRTRRYLSQLSDEARSRLVEAYRQDLEAFDYDPRPYL